MSATNNASRMRVMGTAMVINEVMNGMLPRLGDGSPSSQFSLRLEGLDGDEAAFGLLVRDGFSDEIIPDYEMPVDFTFECGRGGFFQNLCEVADRFVENADLVRSCYQGDGDWGEELAYELEASAALLRLEDLWSEGEEVWAARGDDLAKRGNEELSEVSRRFEDLSDGRNGCESQPVENA